MVNRLLVLFTYPVVYKVSLKLIYKAIGREGKALVAVKANRFLKIIFRTIGLQYCKL